MKPIKQTIVVDDFELEDNYDFSDGIRGRFYVPMVKKHKRGQRAGFDKIFHFIIQ